MSTFIYILIFALNWVRLEATIQRDILTYVNDLRHLHSAGPLIMSPTISAMAQKSAERFSKSGGDSSVVYNSQFSTNHCIFNGRLSQLPKTCAVSWYTTMKDHSWCRPQREGKARPFINMIWNATARAGIGVSQGKSRKYFVVVYFSPRKTHDVKQNVKPVKIVTQASPKAVCAKGYSRFGSSCFKFHPEKVTWEQAIVHCANENATLTSIRNKEEEKSLRNLQERGKGKGWMWIGLHDRLHEGHFAWLDGLDFAPGICAPVTTNGGSSQNCVAWTTNKPLSCWSDKACSERHPFMCRMPIEGKLTFRVEILFKKYRWNPNFRNKQSKAFKDLNRGIQVTFKEVFQRSSGRIGGGLRGIKIKAVRPFSMQGRRRGTTITLSLQFRSQLADPTVKFQKFLRPSERLLSVTVDSPVIHKSSLSNTQCFFPCRKHGQNSCPTSSYTGYPYTVYHNTGYHNTGYHNTGYHNTGYHTGYHNTGGYHSVGYHNGYHHVPCPTACTHYTYSCPTYCPQSCCSKVKQRKSPSSPAKPTVPSTQATTLATVAVVTGTAKPPEPLTQAPVQYQAQQTGYNSYQPYNQCNTCHLYSSPYCYTYCDEACCKHGNKAGDLHEMLADMRENLKKFQAIAKLGKSSDLPGFQEEEFQGNEVPLFGKKAKLAVKTLKKNIEKLEAKIKRGKKLFANKNNQNDFQGKKHNSKEVNTLPYLDEDELSDIDNDESDIDGELLELKESKIKDDYPHMHPDDKNTEREKADSYVSSYNYGKAHKNKEFGQRHPDSPTTIYENSLGLTQTPKLNTESYPQLHPENSIGSSENDFKEEKVGDRHPDSPPTIYENSLRHNQDTAEVDSYPKIHPDNESTGSSGIEFQEHTTYHPDSPPATYEQSFDHTQETTANTESYPNTDPVNKSTGSSESTFEENATYHPDSPPATYEQSFDHTQKTIENTGSYPNTDPVNKITGSSESTFEENTTYHPDSPPATYEQSFDHAQETTANTESYPNVNPDNKSTGSSDSKFEESATNQSESPLTMYEQPFDHTRETTTADDKYVDPDEPKETGTSVDVKGVATTDPDIPPDTFNDYSQSLTMQNNKDVNTFQ